METFDTVKYCLRAVCIHGYMYWYSFLSFLHKLLYGVVDLLTKRVTSFPLLYSYCSIGLFSNVVGNVPNF